MDTTGLLLVVLVTGAGVQDRHGARLLLWTLACCFARISMVWVDGGYSGGPVDYGAALGQVVQVVAKLAGQIGFTVLPRRWVVERTFAWINRCRRTTRDYERLPEHHAAMVQWSMVIIMTRTPRPAPHQPTPIDQTPEVTLFLPGSDVHVKRLEDGAHLLLGCPVTAVWRWSTPRHVCPVDLDQFHMPVRTSNGVDRTDPLLGDHLKNGLLHGPKPVPCTRRYRHHLTRATLPTTVPSPDQQSTADDVKHFFAVVQMDRPHIRRRQPPHRQQQPRQSISPTGHHPEPDNTPVRRTIPSEKAHHTVLPRPATARVP